MVQKSIKPINVGSGQIKECKLKGANDLFPDEFNHEQSHTQMQLGGEGGADIRFTILFVSVFLSLSLLAFAIAFPGFSGKEKEAKQRERGTSKRADWDAGQPIKCQNINWLKNR